MTSTINTVVPSLLDLSKEQFHVSAQEYLKNVDQDTIKLAIISHLTHNTNHLQGRTAFVKSNTYLSFPTSTQCNLAAERKLNNIEASRLLTDKLTGIADWNYENKKNIMVRMDSPVILPFWMEVFFTKLQFERASKGKQVENLLVKGKVAYGPSKLVAVADNNVLRIDDECNPEVWITTFIPKEKPSNTTSSWEQEIQEACEEAQEGSFNF